MTDYKNVRYDQNSTFFNKINVTDKTRVSSGTYGEITNLLCECSVSGKKKKDIIVKQSRLYDKSMYIASDVICEVMFSFGGSRTMRYHYWSRKNDTVNFYMDKGINNFWLSINKTPETLLRWTRDILLAVHQLHFRKISHNDIKPQNMVLVNNVIILIDFGIATFFHDSLDPEVQTTPFRSPELFMDEIYPYNHEPDVWALGMTLVYIIFEDYFFVEKPANPSKYFPRLVSYIRAELKNMNLPKGVIKTIRLCLEPDPKKRKNVVYIYQKVFDRVLCAYALKVDQYLVDTSNIEKKYAKLSHPKYEIFKKIWSCFVVKTNSSNTSNLTEMAIMYITCILCGSSVDLKKTKRRILNDEILKVLSVCHKLKF
jgi:serine/threonine protein kinase